MGVCMCACVKDGFLKRFAFQKVDKDKSNERMCENRPASARMQFIVTHVGSALLILPDAGRSKVFGAFFSLIVACRRLLFGSRLLIRALTCFI